MMNLKGNLQLPDLLVSREAAPVRLGSFDACHALETLQVLDPRYSLADGLLRESRGDNGQEDVSGQTDKHVCGRHTAIRKAPVEIHRTAC